MHEQAIANWTKALEAIKRHSISQEWAFILCCFENIIEGYRPGTGAVSKEEHDEMDRWAEIHGTPEQRTALYPVYILRPDVFVLDISHPSFANSGTLLFRVQPHGRRLKTSIRDGVTVTNHERLSRFSRVINRGLDS